jgi:chitinase
VYYESWSDNWAGTGASLRLAKLPSYVNMVLLSFMQPDSSYSGGVTFAGTGIQFSSDASVVKDAIALLKARNPGTKVLVAVGGATYNNWGAINVNAIASFVSAFGLDGVDIDYEKMPEAGSCPAACSTDAELTNVITKMRAALPRPAVITAAPFSVGAYGQGAYVAALPRSSYYGMWVKPLQTAGAALDQLNLMTYDAGGLTAPASGPTMYDPTVAFMAYKSLFSGNILVGLEVPPEAWGDDVITTARATQYAAFQKANGGAGMMLWSLQKQGSPSVQQLSDAVCAALGLPGCGAAL